MRRLAQGIVGALALAIMLISQPWELRDCRPPECSMSSSGNSWYWSVFGTLIEFGLVAVIITLVLVGVLGMRDSGRSSEAAVLSALGQSQRSATAEAARRGAIDGGVVVGGAFLVGGALHVWLVLSSGYGLFEQDGGLWLARLVVALMLVGSLTVAHVVDAVRPRRTPVERLHEDAAPPVPRLVSLRARTALLLAPAALLAGVIVGAALAHDGTTWQAGTPALLITQIALVSLAFVGIALFFLVAVPLARAAMPLALRAAGRTAGRLGAARASALLDARSATASAASARTILAIAGLALLAGLLCIGDSAPALAPNFVGVITAQPTEVSESVAAEYAAIPGVGAVVQARSFGEGPSAIAVDPAELRGIDDSLAGLLTKHPDAVITSNSNGQSVIGDLATERVYVTGIVPVSTCCAAFTDPSNAAGEAVGASFLIYAEPGADITAIAQAVDAHTITSAGIQGYGSALVYYGGGSSSFWPSVITWCLLLVVCGGPVVALAWGVAARRRRDDATLGALGATRRTLTGAAVAETSVIAFVAIGAGLLFGAALQTALSLASHARSSLWGVITDSFLDVALHSVAWGPLLLIWAGSVAVFALVAWFVSRLGGKRLPAEQLRAAEAGRV